MKILLWLGAAALTLGCSKSPSVEEVKKTAADMRSGDTAPVKYVNSLQNDAMKAAAAVQKTNAATALTQQAADNAVKEVDESGQTPQ